MLRPVLYVAFQSRRMQFNQWINEIEGRITQKIVYKIFVISKSQDFFERFLGTFGDFLTNF